MNIKTRKQKNKTGKCKCDICEKVDILEVHHMQGRKIDNPNHQSNLCDICPSCHSKIHYGFIVVEKWIMTSSGMKLFWHEKNQESFSGEKANPPLLT